MRDITTALLLPAAVILCASCGGNPPPPTTTPPAATAEPVATAAPTASAKANAEAAQQCLATANATRAKFSGEPPKVGVKHVLVKWKGAKNPAADVTRTREEACLRAVEARDKLRKGADFDEVVKEYSDEAGAAGRGGKLGTLERKELAKPFADAAFELGVNQLSDVVETESGFHLIVRTE